MNADGTQRTLSRDCVFSGIGLHTGAPATVTVKPAAPGTGLRFYRAGRPLQLRAGAGRPAGESLRCSSVGEGAERVQTVEHLLSALSGLGVDNAAIHVEGPEIPILDGSALPFARALAESGIRPQDGAPREIYRVRTPLFCYDNQKALCAFPSDRFRVSYVMDYDHPGLRGRTFEVDVTAERYMAEIAPARTFCTEAEAETLRRMGFGKGADTQNTLVIGQDGLPIDNTLRFADETVRHKVLDLIGDLALAGTPIAAHVVAIRSGHALNAKLVETIQKERGLS